MLVSEWLEAARSLARLIAEGSQEERDRYGELLRPVPVRRARPASGCCTPTRTRATSGCSPDGRRLGVVDYGAVARLPGGELPPAIGALLRIALRDDYDEVLAGLRDEGFVKPDIRVDAEELRDYLGPFVEPAAHDDVPVLPRAGCASSSSRVQRPAPARRTRRRCG